MNSPCGISFKVYSYKMMGLLKVQVNKLYKSYFILNFHTSINIYRLEAVQLSTNALLYTTTCIPVLAFYNEAHLTVFPHFYRSVTCARVEHLLWIHQNTMK